MVKKILVSVPFILWTWVSQAGTQYSEIVSPEIKRAAEALGASMVSEVSFEPGSSQPTSEELKQVRSSIEEAQKHGKIKEVQILSWSDREYPGADEKDTNSTVRLAEARANTVENYLSRELKLSKIKKHNMAKRPSALQERLKTKTARVKDTLESQQAIATSPAASDFKGKASTALVLIYTK